jgi:flagellar basal-body rod protein FlgG
MFMGYGVGEVARASESRILQLDVIANNLANAGTAGFKAERYHAGTSDIGGSAKEGSRPRRPFTLVDHGQGAMEKTDNPLDLAIEGDGFFTLQTRDGIAYTRKGNFAVDKRNRLVTQSGDAVLGNQGPIVVTGRDFEVDAAGRVYVGGQAAGELRIARFENRQALSRTRDGLFTDGGEAKMKKMENPTVKPRQLERSNVNPVREMADMIDLQRSFETYQKAIQTIADLDKMAISRVGKLA